MMCNICKNHADFVRWGVKNPGEIVKENFTIKNDGAENPHHCTNENSDGTNSLGGV